MIYLFVPGSIIYSQVIKPHWYGLLWANLSILFALKYLFKESKNSYLFLLTIFLGLAIGSNLLFVPFYIFIVFLLFFLDQKNNLNLKSFFYIIIGSIFIFILTNPYIFLNFSNFFFEANDEYSWVLKGFNANKVFLFFSNSYIIGLGIFLSLVTIFY